MSDSGFCLRAGSSSGSGIQIIIIEMRCLSLSCSSSRLLAAEDWEQDVWHEAEADCEWTQTTWKKRERFYPQSKYDRISSQTHINE
jgi:hypothetical protein